MAWLPGFYSNSNISRAVRMSAPKVLDKKGS